LIESDSNRPGRTEAVSNWFKMWRLERCGRGGPKLLWRRHRPGADISRPGTCEIRGSQFHSSPRETESRWPRREAAKLAAGPQ